MSITEALGLEKSVCPNPMIAAHNREKGTYLPGPGGTCGSTSHRKVTQEGRTAVFLCKRCFALWTSVKTRRGGNGVRFHDSGLDKLDLSSSNLQVQKESREMVAAAVALAIDDVRAREEIQIRTERERAEKQILEEAQAAGTKAAGAFLEGIEFPSHDLLRMAHETGEFVAGHALRSALGRPLTSPLRAERHPRLMVFWKAGASARKDGEALCRAALSAAEKAAKLGYEKRKAVFSAKVA